MNSDVEALRRELEAAERVLAEVELYAQKMLRSSEGTERISGADILQILRDD